jgi:hypothetical protein
MVMSLLMFDASIDRKWNPPLFEERKSRITSKRSHLRIKHVRVRTDDKVYNCKTATISFIFLLILLLISETLNINMP